MHNKKHYILCVDDDSMNLELLEAFLADNYETHCVTDGKQCLDAVAQRQPNLILMDAMMPVMDGKEACKQLKTNETTKNIPVIFLSGRSFPEDINNAYKHGADKYLSKPFSEDQLYAAIRTFLQD